MGVNGLLSASYGEPRVLLLGKPSNTPKFVFLFQSLDCLTRPLRFKVQKYDGLSQVKKFQVCYG